MKIVNIFNPNGKILQLIMEEYFIVYYLDNTFLTNNIKGV